jgi:hypothetical protein
MKPQYFNAEKTAHPNAAEHHWAIVYDPTPGGKPIDGGGRSYSLRFPVLLLTDYVAEPEAVAASVAKALNEAKWREDEAKVEVTE